MPAHVLRKMIDRYEQQYAHSALLVGCSLTFVPVRAFERQKGFCGSVRLFLWTLSRYAQSQSWATGEEFRSCIPAFIRFLGVIGWGYLALVYGVKQLLVIT